MEGNCIRERDKKGRFKKASSTATTTISTCTDENNNHPDFIDVNSEDPLAQVDEYEENKETFDLFQGRRVVEFSILVDHLQRGCFLCHTPLDLVDREKERRYGLASLLYVRCRKCDELTIIPTGKRHNIGQNGQGPFDINTKLAVGNALKSHTSKMLKRDQIQNYPLMINDQFLLILRHYGSSVLWWCWILFPTWISNQRLPDNITTPNDAHEGIHGDRFIPDQPIENHINMTDTPIGQQFRGWTEETLTSNDSIPAEVTDSWNKRGRTLSPMKFLECIKAREISECMHIIENISFSGDDVFRDPSLKSIYDKICKISSDEKTINSSKGISLVSGEDIPLLNEGVINETFYENDFLLVGIMINVIGSGSDLVVAVVILFNHRLHKPFYMSILSLCISDFFYFVHQLVILYLPAIDMCEMLQNRMLLDASLYSVKMFSKLNVVLMASVRYVMFVYPLKSRVHLTNKLIVALSFSGMIFSIAYGTMMRYLSWSFQFSKTRFLYVVDDGILLLAIVVLNFIFLFHRLRVAKRSQAAHNLKLRMTLVVITILIIHIIKSIYTILDNLWSFDISTDSFSSNMKRKIDLLNLGEIFSKLAHFINPFLFFFASPIVIKGVASLLNKCNLKK